MTLERIVLAAISAMAKGTKRAHCFSAHVPGQGHINDGTVPMAAPEYRRQLVRAAQAEYDNMAVASKYAEPGYTDPENGVVFANWNVFPRNFDKILEAAGYAVEWSDEWSVCEDCNGAVRTQPDGWDWTPAYRILNECELLCVDCAPADVLCTYCGEIVTENGAGDWVDRTDGDCCSGNPETGENENGVHQPTE